MSGGTEGGMGREAILHEMGLTPLWVLRGQESEGAEGAEAPAAVDAVAAPATAAAGSAPRPQRPSLVLPTAATPAASGAAPAARRPVPAGSLGAMGWDELEAAVAACRACSLCEQRKQAVLGVGDRHPDWMFIGEGPGADEDEQGEPFVGQAGKLLDAMLAAIDLKRGQGVYIGNAVKCRPPGNRTPEAAEMDTCRPYLERQIELLQPKLIVLLGRAAVHSILAQERPLASLRGRRHEYLLNGRPIPVVVTYHPAYLLRNLTDKARAWEDLCFARRLLAEARRQAG
ncbi:MAG TPA: uracil-DNA glycosylase [Azospira sp.]|nr:uracil-DNA glycosylase [Azospira sp.]